METPREFYRKCVVRLLSEYEGLKTDDTHIELIFDHERGHYLAVWIGWHNSRRIHHCAVHIDLCADGIVIQLNDTEDLLDETLVEMGVPREHIHLALLPPDAMPQSASRLAADYAAAAVESEPAPVMIERTMG